ncbi:flagellar hook capping FlgD N-terminal domain-containing protein [Tepidiforma sp.]|uniref:flagellar hook capping FlgD N-terminal domain-containing protein n=1 Tax=Tepidiforma sp. TaxID=2682230 RepID=UPI002ADE2F36|nr:flagellar hook capping FlgD N-terminal domain-containing protein [Tepidiforma sp.]
MAGLQIDPVTGLKNATYTPSTGAPNNELSQVDFMKLIIAQMRNQNPLEPQKDSDWMAQMAQFEALNQMRAVASGIKVLQGINELTTAAGLIGKTVTGKQVDAIAITRDIVAREKFGRPFAKLTSLERVQVNEDERVVAAAADLPNAGNEVTGVVERVVMDASGIPFLLVNGKAVDLFTVSQVLPS